MAPEGPTTPQSERMLMDKSMHSSSSLTKFIKSIRRRHSTGKTVHDDSSPTRRTKKQQAIDLPEIRSIKSKEISKSRSRIHHFSQLGLLSADDMVDGGNDSGLQVDNSSTNVSIPKSEVNSVLNLNPTSTRGSELPLLDSINSIVTRPSSATSETNGDTVDGESEEKGGLINTLITAAIHHINGPETNEHHASKERLHSVSNGRQELKSKLQNVMTSLKSLTMDPNQIALSTIEPDKFNNHIGAIMHSKSNSASPIKSNSATAVNETPLPTKQIVFEPMKDSLLSTLGKGSLTLSDFDASTPQQESRNTLEVPGITTITRVVSPAISRTREDTIDSGNISSVAMATRFSEDVNDNLMKRKARKVSRNLALAAAPSNEDSDDAISKTETTNTDGISPAVSRVMTNGQSQTRVKSQKIANEKRQTEFHQMFKQIPLNEKLIEDYSCALQKEILVQGRLYISDAHICFNSNILGWVTNFVIPFSEVIQIEKRNTAGLFPNAIAVQTLHSKNLFCSLLNRDGTIAMMTRFWNYNIHGFNKDSLVYRDQLTDDDMDDSSHENDDERAENSDSESSAEDSDGDAESDASFEANDEDTSENLEKADGSDAVMNESKDSSKESTGDTFNGISFQGPKTHAPTSNGYEKKSGETLITDETISAPVGVVYTLLFGDDSSFMKKVLEKGKNFDISEIPLFSSSDGKKTRNYTYVKPLGGPVGPKQTRCIITETVESSDFSESVQVVQSSKSPDVPSGNSFLVKSSILLSWAENNETRLVVLTSVEWSAKSWIKGAVEKGSIDGQKESIKILVSELKSRISTSTRKRANTVGRKKSKKTANVELSPKVEEPPEPPQENAIIQIFKMVGGMLPIPDFLKMPLGVIFGCLLLWMIFFSGSSSKSSSHPHNQSKISIGGHNYLITADSFSSDKYLADQLEYDIWKWIDKRNGEESELHKDKGSSSIVDGYSRQSLEELMKLTQYKLDELKKRLEL